MLRNKNIYKEVRLKILDITLWSFGPWTDTRNKHSLVMFNNLTHFRTPAHLSKTSWVTKTTDFSTLKWLAKTEYSHPQR